MNKKDFMDRTSWLMEDHLHNISEDLDARLDMSDDVFESVHDFAPLEYVVLANRAMEDLRWMTKRGRLDIREGFVETLAGDIIKSLYEMLVFLENEDDMREKKRANTFGDKHEA